MILSAIAAKLKQRAKADFRGRHYEAAFRATAVARHRERSLGGRLIEQRLDTR